MGKFLRTQLVLVGLCGFALPHFPLSAGEGDGAGNGGGSAEKTFLRAHQQLPKLLAACLHSTSCVSTPRGRTILEGIVRGLGEFPPKPGQILFRDSKEFPFNQYRNSTPRSARTGDDLGGTIYVNRDHLYRIQGARHIPIDLAEAAAWLADEYAHQTGFPKNADHSILDHLCHEIERFLSRNVFTLYEMSELYGGVNYDGVSVTTYSGVTPTSYSDLIVANPAIEGNSPLSGKVYSLGDAIQERLLCPNSENTKHARWVTNGFTIHNLHWDTVPLRQDKQTQMLVRGFANYGCMLLEPADADHGIVVHAVGILEITLTYESVELQRRSQNLVSKLEIDFLPIYRSIPPWEPGRTFRLR